MKLKWVKKILTLALAFSVFVGEAAVGPMQAYAAAADLNTVEETMGELQKEEQEADKSEEPEQTP